MTRDHSFMQWLYILVAARAFTTAELCAFADEARASGGRHLEAGWLDAIGVHARDCGWGELIEAGMLASIERKEEDVGA